MARVAPYNKVDFFDARSRLLSFLKNQDRFKGYDFEGSNMSVLVDLLAYNTYNQLQYYNMAIGEMFLDSAQVRNSVVSHAKELNYIPRSRRSAKGIVDLQIRATQDSNTFIVPRFTRFLGRCGNITYEFLTDKAYAAARVEGNLFTVDGVELFEGRIIDEILPYDNTVISNDSIDTRSLQVFVNGVEYKLATTIFGVDPTDPVFYIQPEINDKYSVQFGQNIFGYQPTATDEIRIRYRICSGTDANGVNSYTTTANNYGASSIIAVPQGVAVGGAQIEDTESIRKFAPRAFQVQERAVTAKDYEILLRQRFPQIESISVFGGDEAEPPQFGRVIISVDVKGRDGASQTELDLFKNYIKDKTPIAIEPVFQSAKFMYAKCFVTVKYSRNDSLLSVEQIESGIREVINSYSDDSLNDFDVGLIVSALENRLTVVDQSIDSVSIQTHPVIEWAPATDIITSPQFNFGSELIKPYPYNEQNGLTDFKPSITTTVFTINGQPITAQDDGKGNLIGLIANTNEPSIYRRDLGTVDYNRGIVAFKDIKVESFEGAAIRIAASTVDADVFAPKDYIVRIRQSDVTVSIGPTR
jgi:hypothetical protein